MRTRIISCASITILLCLVSTILIAKSNLARNDRLEAVTAKTETRTLPNFNKIHFYGIGELDIIQDGREMLTIEGDPEVFPKIKSKVEDGIVFLGPDRNTNINTRNKIRYILHVKKIQSIETDGTTKIFVKHPIVADSLKFIIGGSGIIIAHLKVKQLIVDMEGSGEMHASGTAQQQILKIEGAGEFDGKDLKGENAKVDIAGSGSAEFNVNRYLDINISGYGEVLYHGAPEITQKISGSGEVISMDQRPFG